MKINSLSNLQKSFTKNEEFSILELTKCVGWNERVGRKKEKRSVSDKQGPKRLLIINARSNFAAKK